MKTNLRLNELTRVFALILVISFISCNKEESFSGSEFGLTENLTLKGASIDFEDDNLECELIAGKNINAGKVILSHDADYLYVTYLTTGGWTLSEVHLYVGKLDGLPRNKTAIQIGKFPYSASDLDGQTSVEFKIPLSKLSKDENGYTIAAHAVVKNGKQEETAWSNNCIYNTPVITVKSFYDKPGIYPENEWGGTEGNPLYPAGVRDWYKYIGVNTVLGNMTLNLRSYYYSPISYDVDGATTGIVKVTKNEKKLDITVEATYGDLKLAKTYMYVGSKKNLKLLYTGNIPNYELFPYQKHEISDTHSFSYPFETTVSMSFSEAFGSARWGWITYYNF